MHIQSLLCCMKTRLLTPVRQAPRFSFVEDYYLHYIFLLNIRTKMKTQLNKLIFWLAQSYFQKVHAIDYWISYF